MLRSASFVLAIFFWAVQAQAASEADRRNCSARGDAKGRIEACTRVLADQAAPAPLRTMAHRNRGLAYAGRRLWEFAVLDFDEALVREGLEWSMTRGARSGRVAWQFIQDLAGRLGQKLQT